MAKNVTLEDLGYHTEFEDYRKDHNLDSFGIGRIISEHKERYIVKTLENEFEGEIIGILRFSAKSRSDFPAVGDWVAFSEYGEQKVLIHAILPRKTIIERQAVGKQGEKQIIATNIDYALIIQAVDRDYNINRLERYLSICYASKVNPIILLNKIDLIEETQLNQIINEANKRIGEVSIIPISNESGQGIDQLKEMIRRGKTYCLLGSSGVGKSTLLNLLSGKEMMKTLQISSSNRKGRHATTHRELVVLDEGGIIIDNPGMREVGITDSADGVKSTFESIEELSKLCKFKDCTHISEIGCAVIKAVENGEIDNSFYENYLKIEREKEHFESTVAEKRKKDKDFGKMVKTFKKRKEHNRY